jgi:hypothetical protein
VKYALTGGEFWQLHNSLTQLEVTWGFQARVALQVGFVHANDRPNVIPWPDFSSKWLSGDLDGVVSLRVGIDFSGSQSVEIGWVIPLRRVSPSRQPYRESLIVVEYNCRPRLAWRIEYAPGARGSAPPEMWSLYHDEMLWREPTGRIIAVDQEVFVAPDPELRVLRIETFERGSLPILFICTN